MWLNCLSSVAQWKSISTPIWRSEVLNQEGDSKIFFNPLSWSLNKFFVYLIVASWLQVWTTCVILKSTLNKIGSYTSNLKHYANKPQQEALVLWTYRPTVPHGLPYIFSWSILCKEGTFLHCGMYDSLMIKIKVYYRKHSWFSYISFMTTILGQLRYLPFAYSFQLTSPLSFLFNSTVVVLASFSVICMYSK